MYLVYYYIPYEGAQVENFSTIEEVRAYVKRHLQYNSYDDFTILRIAEELSAIDVMDETKESTP